MNSDLYLGHLRELIEAAVVLPSGHFVELGDPVFELHGMGPRYSRVQTQDYRGHRALSYAYLDLPGAVYHLVTAGDNPCDLGTFEDLAAIGADLVERLTVVWIARHCCMPTIQQLGLALIRARAERVRAVDELGVHRLVKWAALYERRAHWLSTHRELAFGLPTIHWEAMRL